MFVRGPRRLDTGKLSFYRIVVPRRVYQVDRNSPTAHRGLSQVAGSASLESKLFDTPPHNQ